MARDTATNGGGEQQTTAEQFEQLPESIQANLKQDAWSVVADRFIQEHPDAHDRLDAVDAWDGMCLEVWTEESHITHFEVITGITYAPGDEAAKQRNTDAAEFLNQFRDELTERVRQHVESEGDR